MTYTWPGRLHLIVAGREVRLYCTLWLFGYRLHVGQRSTLDVDIRGGWMIGAAPNPMTQKRKR